MKILKDRGRALKGCLRISQGEFRLYVVQVKEILVFIHLFLTITWKWKINKALKDKGSRILVVLLIAIASATENRFESNLSYAERHSISWWNARHFSKG